jgi:hypothetical protein
LEIALAVLTYYFGWNMVEPLTFFLGVLPPLAAYVYFAATLQEFSPKAIHDGFIKRKKLKSYRAANFNLEKYQKLLQRTDE